MNNLKQVQEMIADDSFYYAGDSLDIIEIVNAIKSGYRLCKVDKAIEYMNGNIKAIESYAENSEEMGEIEGLKEAIAILKLKEIVG